MTPKFSNKGSSMTPKNSGLAETPQNYNFFTAEMRFQSHLNVI